MQSLLRRFGRDRSGNIALLFGVLIVPIIGSVGSAIDYSHAMSVKAQMQQSADAAAVGALAEQSVGVIAALANGTTGKVVVAEEDAKRLFSTNIETKYKTYLQGYDVNVTRIDGEFTAAVTFRAKVPTSFLMVFGKPYVDVAGIAKAQYMPANFIDFYMMLDNSPSMGLGATTADIKKLESNTSDTCAFACHIEGSSNDYFTLAKKLGVTTRIEVVALAAKKMLETAKNTRRYTDQYRAAVYSMGEKATKVELTEVSGISSNLDTVGTKAAGVTLMSIPYQGYDNDQQTDFEKILQKLKADIGNGGSGINSSDRQKVLLFVSDGVNDSYKPSDCKKKTTSGRCQAPIDFKVCEQIKKKNVRIAVLYTTYLSIDNNSWYRDWIKPFRSEIGTSMESCASPGLYFEVSPSQGITEAMNALFLKVVNLPRLSM